MDPQIAAQFLAATAQVSATIFAIYLAATIFALQDERLSKSLMADKWFVISFCAACFGFCSLMVACLLDISRLNPQTQYYGAHKVIYVFILSVVFLFANFLEMMRRKTVLTEPKKKPKKKKE